jgi:hypothetical protein
VDAPPSTGGLAAAPEDAQLEKLLAGYIGPVARIIVAKARKTSVTRYELLQKVAAAIDDAEKRAAFLRAAGATGKGRAG